MIFTSRKQELANQVRVAKTPAQKAEVVTDYERSNTMAALGSVAQKKEFSDVRRANLAAGGKALPDGSYPIENVSDLANAIQAFGRAKDKDKAKAHIKARAKALGAEDKLPADWAAKEDTPDLAAVLKGAPPGNKNELTMTKKGDNMNELMMGMSLGSRAKKAEVLAQKGAPLGNKNAAGPHNMGGSSSSDGGKGSDNPFDGASSSGKFSNSDGEWGNFNSKEGATAAGAKMHGNLTRQGFAYEGNNAGRTTYTHEDGRTASMEVRPTGGVKTTGDTGEWRAEFVIRKAPKSKKGETSSPLAELAEKVLALKGD